MRSTRAKAWTGIGAGLLLLGGGLATGGAPAGAAVVPLVVNPDPDLVILDGTTINSSGTVSDTLEVVTDVTATVAISHDWVGDLHITLTHVASGTSVVLLDRPGTLDTNGDQSNLRATSPVTYSDSATSEAEAMGSGPGMGNNAVVCEDDDICTYRPHQALSGFDGLAAASEWRLTVSDQSTHNGGSLAWWSLSLTTEPAAPPANGVPVAGDDGYATPEDTPLAVAAPGVLANDTDPDGDALTAAVVSTVANGVLTLSSDGSFTYTPNADYAGPDSFVYQVSDGTDSGTATVTLSVGAVNDSPTVADGAWNVDEDEPLVVTDSEVQALASDPDGDALTFDLVGEPAHGDLELAPTGGFSYTPDPDYHGPDSFSVQADDRVGVLLLRQPGAVGTAAVSNVATFALTVLPVNDAPTAVDDAASTTEPDPVVVSVLANDSDFDGDTLAVSGWTDGADGTVTCGPTTCSYQPDSGFSGSDSFEYTVSDGNGGTDTASVAVTVDPAAAPAPGGSTDSPGQPTTGGTGSGGDTDGAVLDDGLDRDDDVDPDGASGPVPGSGTLPRTGHSSLSYVLLGLGFIMIGSGTVVAARSPEPAAVS